VDRITRTARSISEHNLSQRLEESPTGDELQRLSRTLNEMLARLESAFRRNTQFTADASHELRTPIALMRTTAEIALRRDRAAAEYREALGEILSELERTSRLIEDLLTLARADSGTATFGMAPLDLAASLREAGAQVERLCQEKQVELREAISAEGCQVEGDAEALRRLFLILLDNAVKYTGPGGRIEVVLRQQDGFAIVEVTDTGIGISDEDLPCIFERFYRSDKARSRVSGGAGLGLSIARWIVEAHHGQVQVESALGQGSTFRVSLPLK
jgi:heavy metal sensor kinase